MVITTSIFPGRYVQGADALKVADAEGRRRKALHGPLDRSVDIAAA